MPELPDVEVFREYMDAHCLHQTLRKVTVQSPEILEGISAPELSRKVEGHRLLESRRHGKYLLVHLDDAGWMAFHFGMTGFFQFLEQNQEVPRHTRVLLDFPNGRLAYLLRRKLGRVGYVEHLEDFLGRHRLGPDALDPHLDFSTFRNRAQGRTSAVKCWLMDQALFAGIGNVYSDEILFQARIDPYRPTGKLSEQELRRIYERLHEVLETAIRSDADPERMPSGYLLPHRHAGRTCPGCDGKVKRVSLCGRSAYFCPECQH